MLPIAIAGALCIHDYHVMAFLFYIIIIINVLLTKEVRQGCNRAYEHVIAAWESLMFTHPDLTWSVLLLDKLHVVNAVFKLV